MAKNKKIELSMPVYNEEIELKPHITRLYNFCKKNLRQYNWHITIVDNASNDDTYKIGKLLSSKFPEVSLLRILKKGRGRAIKKVWKDMNADIYAYMDIDLSTDLVYLPEIIRKIEKGADIAIGSRLLPKSKVIGRTIKREILSRIYNIIIKLLFHTKFSDAQCGFKAVSKNVVKNLIPLVKDNEWFMDSELLIIAEKAGYTIAEVPVVWRDNPGSTVRVLPTALGDLKGLLRVYKEKPWRSIKKPS